MIELFVKWPRRVHTCVRLSVRMEQLVYRGTEFYTIFIFEYFRKNVEKIQVTLKHDNKNAYFTTRTNTFMTIPRRILLRMKNESREIVEKNKTHILCSNTFLRKPYCL